MGEYPLLNNAERICTVALWFNEVISSNNNCKERNKMLSLFFSAIFLCFMLFYVGGTYDRV